MPELLVKSATAADGTFSAAGANAWDAGMSPISGQLSVAYGGTGAVTLPAGAIILGNATGAVSSFLTTAERVTLGNGASGLTDSANLKFTAAGLISLLPISAPNTNIGNERFGSGSSIQTGTGHDYNTAIGYNATVTGTGFPRDYNTIIGAQSTSSHRGNTVIGASLSSTAGESVLVGKGITASVTSSVSVGTTLTNSGAASYLYGYTLSSTHRGNLLAGWGLASERDYEVGFGWRDGVAGTGISLRMAGATSAYTGRNLWRAAATWVSSTDATRTARVQFHVHDTAEREAFRIEASGTAPMIGFLGAVAVARQSTTGTTTGFTAGAGTAVTDASTFTGGTGATAYRISDLVLALKNYGLLAG